MKNIFVNFYFPSNDCINILGKIGWEKGGLYVCVFIIYLLEVLLFKDNNIINQENLKEHFIMNAKNNKKKKHHNENKIVGEKINSTYKKVRKDNRRKDKLLMEKKIR